MNNFYIDLDKYRNLAMYLTDYKVVFRLVRKGIHAFIIILEEGYCSFVLFNTHLNKILNNSLSKVNTEIIKFKKQKL